MTDLSPSLAALGDELRRAAEANLASVPPARRRRRRLAVGIAVLAVAVPGIALAADHLITAADVAQSMPAGTLSLAGTEPACTVVQESVEYHCVLTRPPAPEVADWKGTVEPTVDQTKHVNGGCRSLSSDGTEWECYVGTAAVEQQIVSEDFLGEYAPGPAVG